jgi:hypothetical protein
LLTVFDEGDAVVDSVDEDVVHCDWKVRANPVLDFGLHAAQEIDRPIFSDSANLLFVHAGISYRWAEINLNTSLALLAIPGGN